MILLLKMLAFILIIASIVRRLITKIMNVTMVLIRKTSKENEGIRSARVESFNKIIMNGK